MKEISLNEALTEIQKISQKIIQDNDKTSVLNWLAKDLTKKHVKLLNKSKNISESFNFFLKELVSKYEKSGSLIRYISPQHLTDEIKKLAIQNERESIQHIDFNEKLMVYAISCGLSDLNIIKVITKPILLELIKWHSRSIKIQDWNSFSSNLRNDPEIIDTFNRKIGIIYFLQENQKTIERCEDAFKADICSLCYFPKKYLTLNHFEILLNKAKGYEISAVMGSIPEEFQNRERCLKAVKVSGLCLKYCKFVDKEIYEEAVKNDPWALEFVPKENQTLKMCLNATIKDSYQTVYSFVKIIENPNYQETIDNLNILINKNLIKSTVSEIKL